MNIALLTDQDREVLKSSLLCSAMSDADLASIITRGGVIEYRRSEYLFEQGERAETIYLILEGWAQITRDEVDGSNTLVEAFHKGDCLAEAPALLGKAYPASCQAMTDMRALALDGPKLLDLMQTNRTVLTQSLAALFQKLHGLVDDVEWLKSRTIRERLVRFLLQQSEHINDGQEFMLPFSKSLIAAKIGTSPQQLSRTFTELKEHGVTTRGQKATIRERRVLRAMIRRH
ncbi:Crp/Fnr family transcriptional regulator [Roseobacter denitrificans]|uniref:Cyclic nucleotide-binding protein n=1 Tax=Roseobacter denitrificans (strain ATCC 33942 / OCh 114) TaxID=375451 RepID=Q16A11_ROSDO|nr:Crp/Fnr family transcriptional regulator [Roseobacter denitrificans]ABG31182.1 cyclic nucleotide-binding protein [Roseobacter denitrificans OCh 114]AVL54241.1 Crp/Fnr family transcriptional regulator [Roseobacter denitrificans]SFF97675.1 cyclic nucleotide-binding protein [Roseobacter denitrificans OCh 114]